MLSAALMAHTGGRAGGRLGQPGAGWAGVGLWRGGRAAARLLAAGALPWERLQSYGFGEGKQAAKPQSCQLLQCVWLGGRHKITASAVVDGGW